MGEDLEGRKEGFFGKVVWDGVVVGILGGVED